MNATFKTWLHSLLAAAIGGGANALLGVVAMPDTFNFTTQGMENIGKIALIGVAVPVLTLLKQSPLPSSEVTTTAQVKTTVEGNTP